MEPFNVNNSSNIINDLGLKVNLLIDNVNKIKETLDKYSKDLDILKTIQHKNNKDLIKIQEDIKYLIKDNNESLDRDNRMLTILHETYSLAINNNVKEIINNNKFKQFSEVKDHFCNKNYNDIDNLCYFMLEFNSVIDAKNVHFPVWHGALANISYKEACEALDISSNIFGYLLVDTGHIYKAGKLTGTSQFQLIENNDLKLSPDQFFNIVGILCRLKVLNETECRKYLISEGKSHFRSSTKRSEAVLIEVAKRKQQLCEAS